MGEVKHKLSLLADPEELKAVNGVVISGGFGNKGIEGEINVIKYRRENNIPFLGLCFGLQLSVLESARNVLDINEATSEEFNEKEELFVKFLPEMEEKLQKNGFCNYETWRIHCYSKKR